MDPESERTQAACNQFRQYIDTSRHDGAYAIYRENTNLVDHLTLEEAWWYFVSFNARPQTSDNAKRYNDGIKRRFSELERQAKRNASVAAALSALCS
jgi:hypothetical protein